MKEKNDQEMELAELAALFQNQDDEPEFDTVWRQNISNYLLLLDKGTTEFEPSACMPYEMDTGCLLVIEDDEENAQVVQQMYDAGVKVTRDVPKPPASSS